MASVWSCIKQKPRNLRQVSEQGTTLSSPPPTPSMHTHPTRWPPPPCAKNYHTSFSLYPYLKHDGEELSLYTRGSLCVYPAAPAPGNKRKPPLVVVEAGKGWRLRGWREERWMETGEREREGERNSLSDSNLGTRTFYDFPPFGKTYRLRGIALGTISKTSFTIRRCVCVCVCVCFIPVCDLSAWAICGYGEPITTQM